MVRYNKDQFLTLYSNYLTTVNNRTTTTAPTKQSKAPLSHAHSVRLTFKRYDAENDDKLNPSCDQTGDPRPNAQEPKKSQKKKSKRGGKPLRGAANPEVTASSSKRKAAEKAIVKPSVLVRAKFGAKKASCVVSFDEVDKFNNEFGTIFRLHSKSLVPAGQLSERLKKRKQASAQKDSTQTPKTTKK